MKVAASLAFATLLIGSEASAQLQSVPEGVSAADRARPDYAPIGGRIGSFFLYPTVSATLVGTDNVRATDGDRESEFYSVLHADLLLRSNLARHGLKLRAFADQSVHARFSHEDVTRFGGQFDGQLDISRDTQLTVRGLAERQAEERSSYNNLTAARAPVRYGHYLAALALNQSLSPVTLSAGLSYDRFDYDNAVSFAGEPISQRYRTHEQVSGTGAATYTIHPGFAVLVRGSVDKRSYPLPANSPLQPGGLSRDSSGARIEAGLKLDLTSLLYGEVRVGYMRRDYSDPAYIDTSGLSFGADLLWNVTPLTSVRFGADRSVDEASSTTIAGNRRTQFDLSLDHELLRNLILTAATSYARIEPLGPVPNSSSYLARLDARYLLSRQVSMRAGYLFNKRTSASVDRRFRENRLSGGLTLTF